MTSAHKQIPRAWNPRRQCTEPKDQELTRFKHEYYSHIDASALRDRVNNFWEMDLDYGTDEFVDAVISVISIDENGKYILPVSWDEIPPGSLLWRVRKMTRSELRHGDIYPCDLWEPPSELVKNGRFNANHEPILYACWSSPAGAMKEARLGDDGSGYLLIAYTLTDSIFVRRIGVTNKDRSLSKKHQEIEYMLSEFYTQVLSMPSDAQRGNVHIGTRKVLEELHPLNGVAEMGWSYGSSIQHETVNVALVPRLAKPRMRVWRVFSGPSGPEIPGGYKFVMQAYSNGLPDSNLGGRIRFFEFPDLQTGNVQDYVDHTTFLDMADVTEHDSCNLTNPFHSQGCGCYDKFINATASWAEKDQQSPFGLKST